MQQPYPILGFGGNDPNSPLQTSYASNSLTSDDGIPMDTNYAPMNSDKQVNILTFLEFTCLNFQRWHNFAKSNNTFVINYLTVLCSNEVIQVKVITTSIIKWNRHLSVLRLWCLLYPSLVRVSLIISPPTMA